MLMIDIGEEIAILNGDLQLPEEIDFLHVTIQDDMKINYIYIFLDVFDCFFRYFSPLLQKHLALPEIHFWELVVFFSFIPVLDQRPRFWTAFIGAGLSTLLFYLLSGGSRNTNPVRLVLTGAAINACLFAVVQGMVLFITPAWQTRKVVFSMLLLLVVLFYLTLSLGREGMRIPL